MLSYVVIGVASLLGFGDKKCQPYLRPWFMFLLKIKENESVQPTRLTAKHCLGFLIIAVQVEN